MFHSFSFMSDSVDYDSRSLILILKCFEAVKLQLRLALDKWLLIVIVIDEQLMTHSMSLSL